MQCLLCQSPQTSPFVVEKNPVRSYFHCRHCDVIFMDPLERMTTEEEKNRYAHHQNQDSEGYRKFLEPLIQDIENYALLLGKTASHLEVLDYGCGPSAFLSQLMAEKKFQVRNYDLFYFTDQTPLQKSYDVITSTEVWEHFHHPFEEILQLTKILKPQGLLAVMTSAHQGLKHFQDWYYRRDLTHVVFFSEKTMQWIAQQLQLTLIKAQSPYWIFQK